MATATKNPISQNPELENPNETLTLTLDSPNPPDFSDRSKNSSAESDPEPQSVTQSSNEGQLDKKEEDGSKGMETEGNTMAVSPTGNSSHENDIQKKLRRAERFGVPVQLSEKEKRNSRAERFGTATGSEASKTTEEQKRKARAERFGISLPDDEAAKKKARLTRFGSDTKIDTLEEEKRKARALRFSQPPSNVVSNVNGKEVVGSNTSTAGNATGGA